MNYTEANETAQWQSSEKDMGDTAGVLVDIKGGRRILRNDGNREIVITDGNHTKRELGTGSGFPVGTERGKGEYGLQKVIPFTSKSDKAWYAENLYEGSYSPEYRIHKNDPTRMYDSYLN